MTSLPAGVRLGSYEIERPLGQGGMGTVYRARDLRLGRAVALKHLRADTGTDAVLRQRFEQEARAAAALNHPNVCTLYDVGQQDGVLYLVMELLEGQTLARRLERAGGALPIAEALDIAAQAAEALAAAHRAGIVHRDVKPGNIMLASGGAVPASVQVKLLDFGVARLRWLDDAKSTVLTGTRDASVDDMAGTLPYMAPEQLSGQADWRTDIFALGCVLFEMLAGRRALAAESPALLLAAIAEAAVPPIASVRTGIPPALERTVARCLAREPDRRWQSAADVADELRWIAEGQVTAPALPGASAGGSGARRRWWAAAAVAAALLVGATYFVAASRMPVAAPTYIDDLELPPGTTHWAGLSLSPDGDKVAVVTQPTRAATRDPRLWIRDIGGAGGWQLISGQGDEVPMYPFWSPDGRSLAYFVDGRLVRVEPPNLTPIPIASAPDGRGGAWLDDGTIVLAPGPTTGLWRVPAAGGTPELFRDRAEGEVGLKFPVRTAGTEFLFWAQSADPAKSQAVLIDLRTPDTMVPVVATRRAAAYGNHTLFYWRDGVLLGQPMDPATGRLSGTGAPVPLDMTSGVAHVGFQGVSAAGGQVAVSNRVATWNQLTWVDRSGAVTGQLGDPLPEASPDISPDGRHLVSVRTLPGGVNSLWTTDLQTGATRQLGSGQATNPVWSPDGGRLLFQSDRGTGGNANLYQLSVDDPMRVTPVVEGLAALGPAGWLASGDGIAFRSFAPAGLSGISFPAGIHVKRGEVVTSFRSMPNVNEARLSPTGTHIAWVNGEVEQDVLLDRFPVPDARPVQVSRNGGSRPRWRGDGGELYFLSGNQMMAVTLTSGSAPGAARPLFALPAGDSVPTEFAVTPDGQRFLIVLPTSRESATVKLTRNWR